MTTNALQQIHVTSVKADETCPENTEKGRPLFTDVRVPWASRFSAHLLGVAGQLGLVPQEAGLLLLPQ